MNKTIFIICDGLRDDTAAQQMGFMEHLVETKRGARFTSQTLLPTVSKSSYETLHTGLAPIDHGITGNLVTRPSRSNNLFRHVSGAGLTTIASAYYWIFELYVGHLYDPVRHSEHTNPSPPIQHGSFYKSDSMPDEEVLYRGANLISNYEPNFALIHTMGLDFASHNHGSDSPQYRNAAIHQDQLLAALVPEWTEQGFTVVVTSDHGHSPDREHGGTGDDVRLVPLYFVPAYARGLGLMPNVVSHLSVAPTICESIGLPAPASMRSPMLQYSARASAAEDQSSFPSSRSTSKAPVENLDHHMEQTVLSELSAGTT